VSEDGLYTAHRIQAPSQAILNQPYPAIYGDMTRLPGQISVECTSTSVKVGLVGDITPRSFRPIDDSFIDAVVDAHATRKTPPDRQASN